MTNPATYEVRTCPLCGQDRERSDLVAHSREMAESLPFATLQEQWYGFFKEKSFFSYFRCSACQMLYAPRYFTAEQLGHLYASMPANMAEVNDDALGRTQLGYLKELRKVSALTGSFLEIGPDVGIFAEHCAKLGAFSEYWLFEPNVPAHQELRSRLASRAYEISTSLLDLSSVPDSSVSVAAMIHVLDHILEPAEFLRRLRRKMRPDAKLLIVTHNERSLMASLLKAKWPAYCLQHPHLFNPTTMASLLKCADFDTIRIVRSINHFPITFLAKHLLYMLGLGKVDMPLWPMLQIPLKLGNIISLATPTPNE